MENKFIPVETEERAEYIVSQVAASFSFEGMIIPDNEREMLKQVALGKMSRNEYFKKIKEN